MRQPRLSPILRRRKTYMLILTLVIGACGSTPTEPTSSGPFAKPRDAMTGLTITSDLPNTPVPLIKLGTPVEFSVMGHGGRAPYEFRWTVNGVLLRDWDAATALTFNGIAADGRSTGGGRKYFAVYGRSAGRTQPETGAVIEFDVANCEAADRTPRAICQSGG